MCMIRYIRARINDYNNSGRKFEYKDPVWYLFK